MFSLFIKRERKRECKRESIAFKNFFEKGCVAKDYFSCLVNQKLPQIDI